MGECDIIIPVWNMREMTEECVDSINRDSGRAFRLIIVDNGSDEETAYYLKALEARGALLIRNDKNLGFAKAVNQGLKASTAPYVCVMNNDTIAAAGWLGEMCRVMEAHPEIGILNPSSNTLGQFPGGDGVNEFAAKLRPLSGATQELSVCRGFCMLIRRDVIDKVGLLDEKFDIGFFEETDYCKRAGVAGFKMARAKAAYVYHRESASFSMRPDTDMIFRRNELRYFAKWGRPVQAAYFATDRAAASDIDDIASGIARAGHKMIVFLKKGVSWPVKTDHIDIARFDLDSLFFVPISVYKILKRKKKKKLDVLITDSAVMGSILKGFAFLHGSSVLVSPTKEAVLSELSKISVKSKGS